MPQQDGCAAPARRPPHGGEKALLRRLIQHPDAFFALCHQLSNRLQAPTPASRDLQKILTPCRVYGNQQSAAGLRVAENGTLFVGQRADLSAVALEVTRGTSWNAAFREIMRQP